MPYPSCDRTDELCTQHQEWHNNYATSVLSQYMKNELMKNEFYYGDLRIVDSLGIMGANMKQYECMNHFLCRHGKSSFLFLFFFMA